MVQIATMGAVVREMFAPLFDHVQRYLNRAPALAMAE
jgi:hypothetical protein